jgi:hypothetical protein
MIHVGAVLGGPELACSAFSEALSGVCFPEPGMPWPEPGQAPDPRGYRERNDPRDVGSLDVVFHVPGSLLKPEHAGMRTGRLSRKERMLQIQIAVPETLLASTDGLRAFILAAIADAIDLGAQPFKRARITYPEAEYRAQLEELKRRLVAREGKATPGGT